MEPFLIELYDKGLNKKHRQALRQAIDSFNRYHTQKADKLILMGTKNLLRGLKKASQANKLVIYLTGFGRLYTEYGVIGRFVFHALLSIYKFKKNLSFIVENNQDAEFIRKAFPRRNVFVSNSSGLVESGFAATCSRAKNENITFGYLARFDHSKLTQHILETSKKLPPHRHIIIAGDDISGNFYSKQFEELARQKTNVSFVGYLKDKKQITDFYNSIDTLLYPTKREGLPMTLLEAIAHRTDFITSDVPGANKLAQEFSREMWPEEKFAGESLLSYKPKKYSSNYRAKLQKYLIHQVEQEYLNFFERTFDCKISIYETKNTNQLHRKALQDAVYKINSSLKSLPHELMIVVGTRNMIKTLPKTICRGSKTIMNIVGFGRLYTDYGFLGRFVFNSIVWLHDRTNTLAFIVEHETDKQILQHFVKNPVYTTHGSGLNVTGFRRKYIPRDKKLRIGYLSRFHVSKGSHEILKAAKNLPSDRELIIAGWDINGNKYSEAFQKISINKQNVIFLGRLNSRKEVSKFFNNIDLFLSPSIREGGNIALQEAIWHKVPFMTTNVPGCDVLAKIFDCPALNMEDFGNKVLDKDLATFNIDTSDWDEKIKPFLTENVEKEYFACLSEVIKNIDG